MGFAPILFYAWLVGQGHFDTTSATIGGFVTMMFTQFVIVSPTLHEMFHRENLFLPARCSPLCRRSGSS
jgi:hypothetical protein